MQTFFIQFFKFSFLFHFINSDAVFSVSFLMSFEYFYCLPSINFPNIFQLYHILYYTYNIKMTNDFVIGQGHERVSKIALLMLMMISSVQTELSVMQSVIINDDEHTCIQTKQSGYQRGCLIFNYLLSNKCNIAHSSYQIVQPQFCSIYKYQLPIKQKRR